MEQISKVILIFLVFMISTGTQNCKDNSNDKKTIEAGKKMQDFVISISNFARNQKPDFIVIPQNGAELAFTDINPTNDLNSDYLDAIDGIGIEELFYNEVFKPDIYRIDMLRKIGKTKKIMVSEVIYNKEDTEDAIEKNLSENFIPFIRTKENYHYKEIPPFLSNENNNSISKLQDIQNYLYLINNSEFQTKEEYIKGIENNNADLVIIDAYYLSFILTKKDLERLKIKKNGSKRLVIAYMNVGAAENWRSYWKADWKLGNPKWLKKEYKGYDNEIIVEYWHPNWQKIIIGDKESYLQKIIDIEFDGVYLDNVEAYYTLYN